MHRVCVLWFAAGSSLSKAIGALMMDVRDPSCDRPDYVRAKLRRRAKQRYTLTVWATISALIAALTAVLFVLTTQE